MATLTASNGVEFKITDQRGNIRLECRGQYLLIDPHDVNTVARAIRTALARADGLELLPQSVGPKLGVKRSRGGIGLKRIYGKADVAHIFLPTDIAGQIAEALTREAGVAWL
ncbi:hypothetical protein [Mycolicibacterium fortuitum]|uniref:hypothetical protein n=1 Tax=Mycolicibacterium fortuitum TaxID=1766 RepID=UPI0014907497|nr:hypothetical protein [Mycolicibacterium fortuitum]